MNFKYIFEEVDLGLIFLVYVLHVQNLCELRKRKIPLLDLFFFLERNIKEQQKYIFIQFLIEVGYRRQMKLTSGR